MLTPIARARGVAWGLRVSEFASIQSGLGFQGLRRGVTVLSHMRLMTWPVQASGRCRFRQTSKSCLVRALYLTKPTGTSELS